MSLLGTVDGKERGVDHFWNHVHRTARDGPGHGWAGPFTLHELCSIARRVKNFQIESSLEYRSTPGSAYVALTDVAMEVRINGQVSELGILEHGLASELEYAFLRDYSRRTTQASYLSQIFYLFFERDPDYQFAYRSEDGTFWFAVGISISEPGTALLEIPVELSAAYFEQTEVVFNVFDKRVSVYAQTPPDNEAFRGAITFGPAPVLGYWPYADPFSNPTFDANTGAFARFGDTGAPIIPHWM